MCIRDSSHSELTLDYLGKGSIIRPNHFLVNRRIDFSLQAVTKVVAFRLTTEQFIEVCCHYPEIAALVDQETIQQNMLRFAQTFPLDYVKSTLGKDDTARHIEIIRWNMKNAALFYLKQHREHAEDDPRPQRTHQGKRKPMAIKNLKQALTNILEKQ